MYTIIGADGREYGPVAIDHLKVWVATNRVDARTRARAEGSTEWKTLGEFPDLAVLFDTAPPRLPPRPAAAPAEPMDAKTYAEDLIARAPQLSLGAAVERSWRLLVDRPWHLIGVTLLVMGIEVGLSLVPKVNLVAGFLLTGVFVGGLSRYFLLRYRGGRPRLADAFSGFTLAFVPLMLGSLVSGMLNAAGFFLLVVPGIYLMVAWVFTPILIIDKKLDFLTAMEVSRRVVTAQWWRVFGLLLLCWLINILGALTLLVGLVVTIPVAYGALVAAYETLCNPPPRQ